ncbi:MAG: hypothetical protein ACE15D_07100 [Candidatus Eisenbacteria bacterium]|nr:hypothetical protein [Candidatus Eisenbacteria bacterium]
MKIQRNHRGWAILAILLLGVALTGEVCTEDRNVDIVVGADVVAAFQARGTENALNDEEVVSLDEEIDLSQILEDNGIDSLVSVSIEAVFVRVTKQDPTSGRTVSGNVTVGTLPGPDLALIDFTSIEVNDEIYADWSPLSLEAPGVDLLNYVLQDLVDQINGGVSHPTAPDLVFKVSGVSEPQSVETNFDWEFLLRLNIVGTTEVTVVDPL